jgi:glutamate-1-semialdehyde aminotransferase
MEGIQRILVEYGVEGRVLGLPSMFGIFLGEGRPTEYRNLAGHDARLYTAMIDGMIRRGVMPCIDGREPWFTCASHTMEDVGVILEAMSDALVEALARAGSLPSHLDEAE